MSGNKAFYMKVIIYFKNLLRRIFNLSSGSNYMSGWGWRNVAPAGGVGKYRTSKPARPAVKSDPGDFKKYTRQEVKMYLRSQQHDERARPIMAQASQFGGLLQERMRRQFRGRERIFERLPYVLYQYTQGKDPSEIAHSVSFFADGEDIEQAMDFAATLIANRVNRANQRSSWF